MKFSLGDNVSSFKSTTSEMDVLSHQQRGPSVVISSEPFPKSTAASELQLLDSRETVSDTEALDSNASCVSINASVNVGIISPCRKTTVLMTTNSDGQVIGMSTPTRKSGSKLALSTPLSKSTSYRTSAELQLLGSEGTVSDTLELDGDTSYVSINASINVSVVSPCGKATVLTRKNSDLDKNSLSTPTSKSGSNKATLSTPLSKSTSFCTDCNDAMCAVCLSPLQQRASSASRVVVVTRCKHQFHDKCLIGTKQRKAECPYCRTALTPLTSDQQMQVARSPSDRPPPRLAFMQPGTATMQRHIVQAASRAREAVRLAAVRREHEQRRALMNNVVGPELRSAEEGVCAGV